MLVRDKHLQARQNYQTNIEVIPCAKPLPNHESHSRFPVVLVVLIVAASIILFAFRRRRPAGPVPISKEELPPETLNDDTVVKATFAQAFGSAIVALTEGGQTAEAFNNEILTLKEELAVSSEPGRNQSLVRSKYYKSP